MKMRLAYVPMLLCGSVACSDLSNADERSIRAVMAEQEQAWDNGDIPAFMKGYADSICFVGSRGRTCGKDAVTTNYLRSYPDKATMGDLSFGIHEVLPAGSRNAWVSGTWTLYRRTDTIGGSFSLLWAKHPEGWRIVRDHTN